MTERELWSYTFRRTNLVELAAAAAAAGFDCVTSTTRLFERSGGDAADLRARVEEHGVRVTFVDGLATALPGTDLPPGEATIDDCIHIAHATGADAINLVHMTGRPMPLAEMADAFGRACEHAAPEDIRLAIEFIPDTGIPDFATAAAPWPACCATLRTRNRAAVQAPATRRAAASSSSQGRRSSPR